MELIVDENKMRELLKDTLVEIMKNKRQFFRELVMEAIEDIGLANAIKAGRKNKFVDESRIIEILKK